MSLTGLPDWHAPLSLEGLQLHAAWDQPGRFTVVPQGLVGSMSSDGPVLFDIYQQDLMGQGLSRFGLLNWWLDIQQGVDLARAAAFRASKSWQFSAMRTDQGWLKLNPSAALRWPGSVLAKQDLHGLGGQQVLIHARLDGDDVGLMEALIQQGMTDLAAQAWVQVQGVAARAPGVLSVDANALQSHFEHVAPTGLMPHDAWRDSLVQHAAAIGLSVDSVSMTLADSPMQLAVMDRLMQRLFQWAAAPSGERGLWVERSKATWPMGRLIWQLDEPDIATRCFHLETDPLGAWRDLAVGDRVRQSTRTHNVPALESGWQQISVDTTLSDPIVGPLALALEVTVPAHPPQRVSTLKRSIDLMQASLPTTLDLRLFPGEALAMTWQVQGLFARQRHDGPLRQQSSHHVLVSPADIDLPLIQFECDLALLQDAELQIDVMGDVPVTDSTGQVTSSAWKQRMTLTLGGPRCLVLPPPSLQSARWRAVAVHNDGLQAATDWRALASSRIDAFDFPGTGARSVSLQLAMDVPSAAVEIAAQDALEHPDLWGLFTLTSAHPTDEWRWFSPSPWTPAYCWRIAGRQQWSAPQNDALLTITADDLKEPAMSDAELLNIGQGLGLLLKASGLGPHDWYYRSLHADVATGPDGRPQWMLLQAGPMNVLAITTQWGPDEDRLNACRQQLSARVGSPADAMVLRPAPDNVTQAQLLLGETQGAWASVGESTTSGVSPYQAAFNLTLSPSQAEAVHQALQRQTGRLGVRYRWSSPWPGPTELLSDANEWPHLPR